MIIAKQHQLLSIVAPDRQRLLIGDSTRVAVIIAFSAGGQFIVYSSDGLDDSGILNIGDATHNNVMLFRDYGSMIQQEVYANFAVGGNNVTITELLDTSFRNQ